jgi:hypothetical protein
MKSIVERVDRWKIVVRIDGRIPSLRGSASSISLDCRSPVISEFLTSTTNLAQRWVVLVLSYSFSLFEHGFLSFANALNNSWSTRIACGVPRREIQGMGQKAAETKVLVISSRGSLPQWGRMPQP